MFRSLTSRTIIAGLAWLALALGAGGWLLMSVFTGVVSRQFDARLEAELDLLSAAIASSGANPADRMADADYRRVYSGAYWQATSRDGETFRSRSLWDSELPVPLADAATTSNELTGPDGRPLRLLSRSVTAPDGEGWTLLVAREKSALQADIVVFRRALLGAALVAAGLLLVAAFLLLRAALAPLDSLRAAVRDRYGTSGRIDGDFPSEVSPLVNDLNAHLERNERLLEKGRLQAATLAHTLKTPAAILANELQKADRNEGFDAKLSLEALNDITAAAERHLSLAGALPDDRASPETTDVVPLAEDVVRAIGRLFPDTSFDIKAPVSVLTGFGRAELMEILGNLVENAAKWARWSVRVTIAERDVSGFQVIVEDDGPGIPRDKIDRVLLQGVRLDPSKRGNGLGLTIVNDIVDRYRGTLSLTRSDLGGLKVKVRLANTQCPAKMRPQGPDRCRHAEP